MAFTVPPKGIIGVPINLNNVDTLSYTLYSKTKKVNRRKLEIAINQYHRVPEYPSKTSIDMQYNPPKEKDFLEVYIIEASIEFTCSSGAYKWTLLQDTTNTLKNLYHKLLIGTYTTKSL
jgi:hypothetical protein